jgi:hypothetical protein
LRNHTPGHQRPSRIKRPAPATGMYSCACPCPKTAAHFSGACILAHVLARKPLRTFRGHATSPLLLTARGRRILPFPLHARGRAGTPGVRHTRSPVCKVRKHTSVAATRCRNRPAFPHAMVLTACFASKPPVADPSVHHRCRGLMDRPDLPEGLTAPASGARTMRRDHATWAVRLPALSSEWLPAAETPRPFS